jgi:hypothetical protein
MFQVYTWRGTCHVIVSGPAYRLDLWEYYNSPVPQNSAVSNVPARSSSFLGFSVQELGGVLHVTSPMWFLVAGFGAIALVLCHKHIKPRFSLRTLLIATTLVAVVLGIIAISS